MSVLEDEQNCGTCGVICVAGRICSSGACVAPCGSEHLFPRAGADIVPVPTGDSSGLAAADVNGDGWEDILIGTIASVAIVPNEGGRLGLPRAFALSDEPATFDPSLFLGAVDVDGDGALDVISDCTWLRAQGSWSFAAPAPLCPSGSRLVDAADIDGDGRADTLHAADDGLWLTLSTSAGSVLLDGDARGGGFVDEDLDGVIDVVTVEPTAVHVRPASLAGAYELGPPISHAGSFPFGASQVSSVALDDGPALLITAPFSLPLVLSFEAGLRSIGQPGLIARDRRDTNGDGVDELIAGWGHLAVWAQRDGSFWARGVEALVHTEGAVFADIDANGTTDIVARVLGGLVTLLEREGAWGSTHVPLLADGGAQRSPPVLVRSEPSGMPTIVSGSVLGTGIAASTGDEIAGERELANAPRALAVIDTDGALPSELYVATSAGVFWIPILETAEVFGVPAAVTTGSAVDVFAAGVTAGITSNLLVLRPDELEVHRVEAPDTLTLISTSATTAIDVLLSADVDGDGDRDLVARANGGNALWLENDGGTFSDRALASSAAGIPLSAADVDADGADEILFSRALLDLQPGGSFASMPLIAEASAAVITDATPGSVQGLAVLRGRSEGTSLAIVPFAVDAAGAVRFLEGVARLGRTIVSIDGDRIGSDPLALLVGSSAGLVPLETVTVLPALRALAVPGARAEGGRSRAADLDADGMLEVAALPFGGDELSVSSADADGLFIARAQSATTDAILLAPQDLDGDGAIEVLVREDDVVRRFLLIDDALVPLADLPCPVDTADVQFVDLDRDGLVDLVAAHGAPAVQLTVRRGLGALIFDAANTVEVDDAVAQILVTDTDGDGRSDVVALGSHTVSSFGAILSGAPSEVRLELGVDRRLYGEAAAVDVDADGAFEVVATAFITDFVGTPLLLRLTQPASATDMLPATRGIWGGASAADMDGDGDLDIVLQASVPVLLENDSGAFTARPLTYAPSPNQSLVDVDGDGRFDILGGATDLVMGACTP